LSLPGGYGGCGGRDRGVGLVAAAQRFGDEARGLHLLDEAAQIGEAGRPPLPRAHRLLDDHEAALDHAHVRISCRELDERLTHPGRDLELVAAKQLDRRLRGRRPHERGALDRAGQVQVVGALLADGDAHAVAVDLVDAAQRRPGRHHVGALDQHVGRREGDLVRAHRVDGQEGDVPDVSVRRVRDLAGGVERDEVDRHIEPAAELAGEVDRHAAKRAGRVALRQHRVAVVDRGAQAPARRELADDFGRGGVRGRGHQEREAGEPRDRRRGTQSTGCHGIGTSR
jgi:hypothetical protein